MLKKNLSFSNEKPVVLEVRNANFSVKTSSGTKKILTDVNLTAKSGGSYALMGPSGAGKTTVLELLTLGLRGGRARGSVTLNGEKLTFETFRQRAVYVEQYDTHWAFLTCKETMEYAAVLYNPGDNLEEQGERVSHVMTKLGLNECADAYVGNEFFKGMSGGQKKRG
jgi:ABC-type multidrug transport system ATPase subunit